MPLILDRPARPSWLLRPAKESIACAFVPHRNEHLRQQAKREELDADEDQEDAEQQQRAVSIDSPESFSTVRQIPIARPETKAIVPSPPKRWSGRVP